MTPAGPSRTWYAVALGLFVLSLVPTFLLGRHAASAMDVAIVPADGSAEQLDDREAALWTNQPGLASGLDCRLEERGSDSVFDLDDGSAGVTVDQDGRSWTRLAVIPPGLTSGSDVVCLRGNEVVPLDELGLSANPDLRGFAISLVLAFVVPVGAALVAAGIAIAVALLRRQARRQVAAEPYLPPPPAY